MNFIKKNKIYFITSFIVILIFALALYLNHIYPFGKKLLGKSDAFVQFKPMLYNFIMKIKTGTLLNYSFNNGLGNATIFDFMYYLSSPLNLIAIFFKSPNAMYLSIIFIKIIITSLTTTKYIKSKTNNTLIIIISSLSYVLSGWLLTYYYYFPWLDIFMIFPLYQYGLEQLLNNHKYHIYIFSLSYMLITNFYLCFSVCMYTILYFIIYELLYKKNNIKEKILSFNYMALSTLLSFLLSFFYLYILYDIIIKTGLFFDSSFANNYSISIIDFIKSLFYGNNILITKTSGKSFPNFNCSILLLLPFIHFFMNKNINKRIKLFSTISIILVVLIIFIPRLDYIFNAFHNIRGLTYRYSFIITLLYIKLVLYDISNTKIIRFKEYLIPIIVIIILYTLCIKNITPTIRVFNITIFISYIIYLLFKNNYKYYKYILFIPLILELLFSTYINIISGLNDIELKPTFKIDNVKYRLTNMDIKNEYVASNLYNNAKVTYLLTSITYNQSINFFYNLGCDTFSNTYAYCNKNHDLINLLINVKSKNNNYYLEKIYATDRDIKNTNLNSFDMKYNLETVIHDMTKIDNIYKEEKLKGSIKNNNYIFKTKYNFYLIDIEDENGNKNNISQEYNEFSQSIKHGKDTATIYVLKKDKLKDIYNYLSKNQIKYTYYNDNHIKGTINVDKDQLIFTSIPYDKDWEVKIDDKIVKPIILLDSLMGIEVKPGNHTIELTYKTHYLIPALISISTFIILLIDIFRKTKTTRK